MHPDRVDAGIARRWLLQARDALGAAQHEIDALNVFPVPDGDTGTNLYLTLESAVHGVADASRDTVPDVLAAAARGAFLGARGNSGVIFSQMFRGVASVLGRDGGEEPGAAEFAAALQAAARAGYDAVAEPVEGTMLTVMAAAAGAAGEAAQAGASLARVVRTTVAAADEAVLATRDQHPTLARAGVVDAGGRGLAVVLAAMDTAMTGRRAQRPAGLRVAVAPQVGPSVAGDDLVEGGPAYEVMYLLEAPDDSVAALRSALAALGDSLLVVGGDGLWNVHVHTDDVGAAVERGIEAGRPFRIRVTHFADQVSTRTRVRGGRVVVAGAAGPGLAALFRDAGALVVSVEPGRLASTADVLAAIGDAAEAVVLPNHRELVPAATAAAHEAGEHGIRVAVVPTRAQVQGLAALAVHEPDHGFDADVVAMTTAAGHVREGAVTVAATQAMTSVGVCRPGDVLGVIGGDFVVIGTDLGEVAVEVLRRMLAAGGELVTVVTGTGAERLGEWVVDQVALTHPEVDVVCLDGGQQRYPVLLGVE